MARAIDLIVVAALLLAGGGWAITKIITTASRAQLERQRAQWEHEREIEERLDRSLPDRLNPDHTNKES